MIANMRILLVEDNEKTALNLIELLQSYTHSVTWCKNGLSGLEEAQKACYDVYIIDHLMPLMNGFQLTKNLKSNSVTKNIPVIFITTKDISEVKSLPESAAFEHLLAKPINAELLIELLNKSLPENSLSSAISK